MNVIKVISPLETTRLILRPFSTQDIATFSAYRSDPDVAKYQGWETPYSLEQAAQFVLEMQTAQPGTPGHWYQLAIEIKSTAVMVGDVAFIVLPADPRQAEIGFTLAKAHQGKGYATEAVTCLLDFLFSAYHLHRVRANCDVDNHASAQLLERVGMRREGHFRENLWFKGRWSSEYWYAILWEEWRARRSPGAHLKPSE